MLATCDSLSSAKLAREQVQIALPTKNPNSSILCSFFNLGLVETGKRNVMAVAREAAVNRKAPVIGIAGGGIGGLALALALQQRGMRVVVWEKDTSFDMRRFEAKFPCQCTGRVC